MTKEILTVNGMICSHCQKSVEKALSTLSGMASIQVDLENNLLTVEFDQAKCSINDIKDAVAEAGYEVAG